VIDPAWGPFLFDTSAESWFARNPSQPAALWWRAYRLRHQVHVSAVTVVERVRGYAMLWRAGDDATRAKVEVARLGYMTQLGHVWPMDASVSVIAGEIMALLPQPPTPARKTHRGAESRQDRLSRWRFDVIIAATALAAGMRLVHNNAADFESIRGALETSPERFPGLGSLNLVRCGSLLPES
jgi:predicted nucleic acid-binding protein